jgi:hypothetical protein
LASIVTPKHIEANELAEQQKARMRQQGHVPNYASIGNRRTTLQIPQPLDKRIETEQQAIYGPPQGWDYRTAQTDWDGKALPGNAEGFTPYGEPWYGGSNSLDEWFRKHEAVGHISTGTGKEFWKEAGDIAEQSNAALKEGDWGTAFGLGFKALIKRFQALGNIGGAEEGEERTTYQKVTSTAFGFLGAGLQRTAEFTKEEIIARAQGVEDVAATSGLDPLAGTEEFREEKVIKPVQEWVEDITNPTLASNSADFLRFSYNAIDVLNPLAHIWNAFRYYKSPLTKEEKASVVDRRVEAGKVLYSSWVDTAITEQYLERVRSGENAYLVQLEMQNPAWETIGEIIFDPLNLIGVVAKGSGAVKKLDNFEDYMGLAASEKAKDLLIGWDNLDEAAKAARLTELVEDTVQAAAKTGDFLHLGIPADEFGVVRKGFNNLLSKTRLTSFTDSAKAWHLQRLSTDYLRTIMGVVGNDPNDVRVMLEGFARLTSSNADEVLEGMTLIGSKLSLNSALSEGGLRFSHVIREMFTDADGVFDLASFSNKVENIDDPIDLLRFYEGKIENASKKIFPTLTDRKKQVDTVMKAVEDGKMTVQEANKAVDMTAMEKVWLGVEGATDNKIVNGIRNFYAQIYMGLSPGYAFRNMFNNVFTTLVDVGPGAYFDGYRFLSPSVVAEQLEDIARGMAGLLSETGFTKADVDDVFRFNTLKWAEKLEVQAAKRIMLKSYKDTFNKMIPKLLDSTKPILESAGYRADEIGHLEDLIGNNWGKVDEAVSAYKAQMDAGYFNIFEGMGWVPDEIRGFLDEFNIMEPVKQALVGKGSVEEAQSAMREIFDSVRRLSDETKHMITGAPIGTNDAQHIADNHYDDAYQAITNVISDNGLQAAGHMGKRANHLCDNAYSDVTIDLINMAKKQADNPAAIDALFGDFPSYQTIQRRQYYDPINQSFETNIYGYNRSVVDEVKKGRMSVEDGFRKLGIDVQEGVTKSNFGDYVFQTHFPGKTRQYYASYRDGHRLANLEIQARLIDNGLAIPSDLQERLNYADRLWNEAQLWDHGVISQGEGIITNLSLGEAGYANHTDLIRLAIANGIPFGTKTGKQSPQMLRTINKYFRDNVDDFVDYARLEDIPVEKAEEALKVIKGKDYVPLSSKSGGAVGDVVEIRSPMPEQAVSEAHRYAEAQDRIDQAEELMIRLVDENFGSSQAVVDRPGLAAGLDEFLQKATKKEFEMRLIAGEVATAARNFALHDYNSKRGFDQLLSMVYPYQFWHSRTYSKWLQRTTQNIGLIAAYAKYKEGMAQAHAGAPEWWKYNINVSELLGIWQDHPIFFNLEATLNPLNGLTGVDFTDPYRRVDQWTATLEDMNRYGPSTHPLISLYTAMSLQKRGEDEAAARWAGRLFPQTQTIAAIDALIGDDPVEERDPFVKLFSGGIDPYTRRRVGRALAQMVIDETITQEQAEDAAYQQTGDIWERAKALAIRERAPGNLTSFFLGAGFKARNQGDLLTDKMYNEFFYLMSTRENMPPEQFRIKMSQLSQEFPFMDTVMVSAKTGEDRDLAYAYSVLGRIPPGSSSVFYEAAGIDREIVNNFYENKGDMSDWTEGDRRRFMAGVIDLAATLSVPDDFTQQDWDFARANYTTMLGSMEDQFGEDIHDKIDAYWSYKNRDEKELADLYLENNPEVEQAMDFKNSVLVTNPAMAPYYASLNKIEGYYKGQMYAQAEEMFGAEIFDTQSEYFSLPENERRAFRRQHPELKQYWDFKASQEALINQSVVRVYSNIREPLPAEIREDADFSGVGVQQIAEAAQQQDPYQELSQGDWLSVLGERAYGLVMDSLRGERQLSYQERLVLDGAAQQLGIDRDRLIQYVGLAGQ